jgi:hypothetical protein
MWMKKNKLVYFFNWNFLFFASAPSQREWVQKNFRTIDQFQIWISLLF